MRNWSLLSKLSFLLVGFLVTTSCHDDEQDRSDLITVDIRGHAQKGPFIVGSNVLVSELTPIIQQTGRTFTSQITDNTGLFEVSKLALPSHYVQLSATGFYFDEVKGAISTAPLTLQSYADIRDASNVNINILTQLEKARIEFLVKQNKTFSEAKKTAQADVLAFFGFSNNKIDNSEYLDISSNSEGNAILLAISVILQGDRSVGNLSELIANVSSSIRDGATGDNLKAELRASAKQLDLGAIRSNLIERYQNLGIEANIPGFEKYVKDFLAFTGKAPTLGSVNTTNIQTNTVTFNAEVNANSLATTVTIEYGTTVNYGNAVSAISNPLNESSLALIEKTLSGLSPGVLYHWRIVATNSIGSAVSTDMTFTMLGRQPVVTTNSATNITSTKATLNGYVSANNLATRVRFEFGTTTAYGQQIDAIESMTYGEQSTPVQAELTELITGTAYHYRVIAENELGTITGEDHTFTASYMIGGHELGGIVFYILQPWDPGYVAGEIHGFVAAPQDQGIEMPWYNGEWLVTGATGTGIGTGATNTTTIINAQGNTGHYAAKVCRDYRGGGYSDWYLPSKDEIALLYAHKDAVGGFDQWVYWSSTEYDQMGACYRDFRTNYEMCGFWKYNLMKIRAIRSF